MSEMKLPQSDGGLASFNIVGCINEVNQRQAQLVLGWINNLGL